MGTATVNGAAAADGTVVSVFVEVLLPSPLTLEVTATGVNGQTATASRRFGVVHLLPSGEATVTGGNYTVKVVQPRGQSFTGKTIRFRVGGRDAGQSAVWVQGEANDLGLTVGTP